jgi:AraC-like DNA-binding protein
MLFDNPILFFFCSLGVFNGFLVSLYFLFFHKVKRTQNLFLGLLLLFLSIRIGKSVYSIFTPREEREILILQIGLSACFLIGFSLFHYIKSSVENRKSIPNSWKLHFILVLIFIMITGITKPYKGNTLFWNEYFIHVIYGAWALYILLSGFALRNIFKKIVTKSVGCTTAELWLVAVFLGNLLIYSAYIIGLFYFYLIGTLTFSFVFYGLLIFLLFKKNRDTIFQDIPEKYGSKKIDTKEANYLLVKLKSIMTEEELYKKPDVKLKDIANELQIIPHKLSQLLNDNVGKSFAQFINEYKVDEAKKLLKENNQFTLEAIGYEAGFSSKSAFYATFKKTVGKTPSEYQKDLKS